MNSPDKKIYLALGDSMSIDEYTGVVGGGAVSQFFQSLGSSWRLRDHAFDGCLIRQVPTRYQGDLLTLTIGGNDAIERMNDILAHGADGLLADHWKLLQALRETNPRACIIVGNVYRPLMPLPDIALTRLDELNRGIRENVARIDGLLADIYGAFKGHEEQFLCQQIEPALQGATVIANLFRSRFQEHRTRTLGSDK